MHRLLLRSFSLPCSASSPVVSMFGEGILQGNKRILAKAITLCESSRDDHQQQASELVDWLRKKTERRRAQEKLSDTNSNTATAATAADTANKGGDNGTGGVLRIGISGAPGVGKSTFIEAFGQLLLNEHGRRVAVLAVDPSSQRTGGSILGDKTRMGELSRDPRAYVRPSPSRGTLGGVTRSTDDALQLCEAAGYNVLIVETVGVGQSETAAEQLVDIFVLLEAPAMGDSLQGIKKGIVEMADLVVVNKCDGSKTRQAAARRTVNHLKQALHLVRSKHEGWPTTVVPCSAPTGTGLHDVWQEIVQLHTRLRQSGDLTAKRRQQRVLRMQTIVQDLLLKRLHTSPTVADSLPGLERAVRDGLLSPGAAATQLVSKLK